MSKICPKCKKDKENKMFFHNSVKADGLSHWCKECSKKKKENCSICGKEILVRTNYQKTCSKECYKENCKILAKKYHKEHKKEFIEYNRKYRLKKKILLNSNK